MLGIICEVHIIMIRKLKHFSLRLKDQYNACINSFLDFYHTWYDLQFRSCELAFFLDLNQYFDVINSW